VKILLVDDEIELVSTLAERMDMRGIDAHWFTNAKDALASAETDAYDLAVLDVKMPKIGGFELRKSLEAVQPRMKFIFLTGHGCEEDYNMCTADGAQYLVKPINIEKLIAKIKEMIGH